MKTFNFSNNKLLIFLILTFIISFIPIFYKLGEAPIRIWDEAIYAVNALEMSLNHDFFVYHVNGEPNMYNVKPPLVIWLQTSMIWTFGPHEWAIRLPSAMAAMLTCFSVFIFAFKNLNTPIAFFSIFFLVTTPGYIRTHVTRTGDLDSVLVFFITFYSLLYFHYLLRNPEKKSVYLVLIGLGVFLAFMAKSVAGLIPVLGLLIGTIIIGKSKEILRDRMVHLVSITVLSACIGFYVFREHLRPGYLDIVLFSEYRRFIDNIMPWHQQPFWFYLTNLYRTTFFPYFILLPFTLVGLFSKNANVRTFTKLASSFIICYFLVISYPTVKLDWYDAPMFPILSLMLGIVLDLTLKKVVRIKESKAGYAIAVILIFAYPYYKIVTTISQNLPMDPLEKDGYAMRQLSRTNPDLVKYKVLLTTPHSAHRDVANFYTTSLNSYHNFNITIIHEKESILSGDIVLCSQKENIDYLNEKFEVEYLENINGSILFQILKQKAS